MTMIEISHVEIPCTDLNKAKGFFNKLFGWEFKPFGNGYLLYNSHSGLTIGLRKVDSVKEGDSTIFHIKVDDIDSVLMNAEKAGGEIFRKRTIIPAMGYYGLIKDVTGNVIGLFQKN
jgi:predicted enzyme related to lactoylglutathione lyase